MEVRQDENRVWIDGVEGFSCSRWASSPHGCQARIAQAVGETVSYDDLVCYGGFAYRTNVHEQMCPSSGHPFCGYECMEGSNRALPWRTKLFQIPPHETTDAYRAAFEAEACAAVKESIDRGVPVHYGSEEDGLIIGYADDGRRWWCVHPHHKDGCEAFWHDESTGLAGGGWPWGIVVWTEPIPAGERLPEADLTIAGLQQAVDMWHTVQRDRYYVGDAAYKHWLGWLRDVDAGRIEDPKPGMQGNGWCYDVLVHGRRIASRWLAAKSDVVGGQAGSDLRSAAEQYAELVDTCMEGLDSPWDLTLWPQRADEWTSALRQEQLTRLEAANRHDRAAITAIESVLARWPWALGAD